MQNKSLELTTLDTLLRQANILAELQARHYGMTAEELKMEFLVRGIADWMKNKDKERADRIRMEKRVVRAESIKRFFRKALKLEAAD